MTVIETKNEKKKKREPNFFLAFFSFQPNSFLFFCSFLFDFLFCLMSSNQFSPPDRKRKKREDTRDVCPQVGILIEGQGQQAKRKRKTSRTDLWEENPKNVCQSGIIMRVQQQQGNERKRNQTNEKKGASPEEESESESEEDEDDDEDDEDESDSTDSEGCFAVGASDSDEDDFSLNSVVNPPPPPLPILIHDSYESYESDDDDDESSDDEDDESSDEEDDQQPNGGEETKGELLFLSKKEKREEGFSRSENPIDDVSGTKKKKGDKIDEGELTLPPPKNQSHIDLP